METRFTKQDDGSYLVALDFSKRVVTTAGPEKMQFSCELGNIDKSKVETELGPIDCWQFTPSVEIDSGLKECKRQQLSEVRAAIEEALFLRLVGGGLEDDHILSASEA